MNMQQDELFSMLDKDKAEEQILEKSKKIEYYITEYSVGFLVQKMQEGEYYVPTGKNAWILSATSSSALEFTSVLHKIWDNNNFFAKNRLPTPL